MEHPILAFFVYAISNFISCFTGVCPPVHWPY